MNSERQQVDRALKSMGFGEGLKTYGLNAHLAQLVTSHEKFRSILTNGKLWGGEDGMQKRYQCYEALRPHLAFKPKPLDVYLAEAAEIAGNREQQQTPLEVLAEKAIIKAEVEREAKGTLTMTCSKCTFEEVFPAPTRGKAVLASMEAGWTEIGKTRTAYCPECSEMYLAVMDADL